MCAIIYLKTHSYHYSLLNLLSKFHMHAKMQITKPRNTTTPITLAPDKPLIQIKYLVMRYQLKPRFSDHPGHSVLAALNQSSIPGVPFAFQDAINSGDVRESMRAGAYPRWTNDSRTTLLVAKRPA